MAKNVWLKKCSGLYVRFHSNAEREVDKAEPLKSVQQFVENKAELKIE